MSTPADLNQMRACLPGGAIGDALGAPIEFMNLQRIKRNFGEEGLTDYAPYFGRLGTITDDTQMILFTLEGVIRGHLRWLERGLCHVPTVVHHAYQRWLFIKASNLAMILKVSFSQDGCCARRNYTTVEHRAIPALAHRLSTLNHYH